MKKSNMYSFAVLTSFFSFSLSAVAANYSGDFKNNVDCIKEFKSELWNMSDVISTSSNTGDKSAVILFPGVTKLKKPLYISTDKTGYLLADDANYDFAKQGVRLGSGSCARPGGAILPGDCAALNVGDHYDGNTNKVVKSFLIKVIQDLTTKVDEQHKRELTEYSLGAGPIPLLNALNDHAKRLQECASYQKDRDVLKAIETSLSKLGLKPKASPRAKPAEKAGAAS